jgi:hypothetical protein
MISHLPPVNQRRVNIRYFQFRLSLILSAKKRSKVIGKIQTLSYFVQGISPVIFNTWSRDLLFFFFFFFIILAYTILTGLASNCPWPDDKFKHPTKYTSRDNTTFIPLELFYVKTVIVWAPHYTFGLSDIKCPEEKCHSYCKPWGWGSPVVVHGLDDIEYLISYAYACDLGHFACGSVDRFLKNCPSYVQAAFPVVKRTNTSLTKQSVL